MTLCQVPPPLVSFLASVAAVTLGQGGPGGSCQQNLREERKCAGAAGRVPGEAVTQLLGSIPKGLQGGSKFTEKEY